MPAVSHPEYPQEVHKLQDTLGYLRLYYDRVISEKYRLDREVEYSLSHYNDDNPEQFNDLILNTTLQENAQQKLKDLTKSLTKPYFARVDFIENNKQPQKLYIGKVSLLKEENHEFLIVDWRAPIANLYYEGRLGKASYTCPDGEVDGEIKLKRQYTIEKAELQELYDIDITTNDDFLQASLRSSKDHRLKDIVSTIQAEQNRVIRADMWRPLVVQGAAGGGKTTIALHRIAYLLYTYEKAFSPKQFMIIAPNRFFLSYISEVLPELGVENVLQTTFEEFASDIVEKKLKLKEPHEKLARLISHTAEHDRKSSFKLREVSRIKSSLQFKDVIEKYVNKVEYAFLPNIDYKIGPFILLTKSQLSHLFLEEYKHLPLMKRINEIKKHLINTLKYNKGPIIDEVQARGDRELQDIRDRMKDSPERRKLIIDAADRRDDLITKIKKGARSLVSDYINLIKPLPILELYTKLFEDKEAFHSLMKDFFNPEAIEWVRLHSLENLNAGYYEIEDLAPLMYLKYLTYGLEDKITVRHVIIDEAQDFSLFQLFVLKKIIGGNSFTILGDLCQGIHSYRGIVDWQDVSKLIFPETNTVMLTLEQSYRTTIEIMEAASSVIKSLNDPNLPPAKPVIRHGDKVVVEERSSLAEVAEEIQGKIRSLSEDGFKSAAIICKTLEECQKLKSLLKNTKIKVNIITGTEKEYSGGVVIIPSYLVKGLEFDMVIVANASKEMYTKEDLDVKLLYVAMTRPLHQLNIYAVGERSDLLKDI